MNEEITFLKILTSKRQYPDKDATIDSDKSKMKYTPGLIYYSKINELIEDSDDYYEESKEYLITDSPSMLYFLSIKWACRLWCAYNWEANTW